jgi:phage regulator Rha-like protein
MLNTPAIQLNYVTMTSREIAELVESRHDVVKKSIERLIERGTISQPPLVDGNKSANGIIEKEYQIGKRDSYIIVAQLSPEFTTTL